VNQDDSNSRTMQFPTKGLNDDTVSSAFQNLTKVTDLRSAIVYGLNPRGATGDTSGFSPCVVRGSPATDLMDGATHPV
jgi:hypothetical protein